MEKCASKAIQGSFRLFLSFTSAFIVFHPRAEVSIRFAMYRSIYFCPLSLPLELRLELFSRELFLDLTSFFSSVSFFSKVLI